MLQKTYLFLALLLMGFRYAVGQTGQWTTVNSSGSPTARHECAYVKAGNKFYLMGGRGNKPVESYNPQTNSWITETVNNPMQMHHFQAVEYNGKIYVVGAFTGNCCHETPVANIYIFDPVTKQWSTGPQIPSNRRRGAAGCVVYNNKIYLVCGIIDGHSSGWVPWLDVFDPQNNTWTQLPDAPRPRDHFYATEVNGKIYCIGGRQSGLNGDIFKHTTPEVDVYNISSNSWTTLPSSKNIPTQRASCATAVMGNEILVIGGEGATVAYDKTEAFNVVNQTWRTLDDMVQTRHATTAVVHNNTVYIAAGAGSRGGSNELTSQEKFSFSSSNTDCNGVPGGTAFVDDCGVCSGGNTGHIANSDKDACGVCFGDGTNCGSCSQPEVSSFTLMMAGTGGEIGPLTDGMTINLAATGPISIRANTCGPNVKSVKFIVNGTTVKVESSAPYAINGDNNGNYNAWNTSTGAKTLTGTPYTQSGGSGTAGVSETVAFTIVDEQAPVPDCNGVVGGTAFIDDCGVCSGGNTGHVANSDKDACGVCFGDGSTCSGECQPLEVVSFTLMRAGTSSEIGPLTDGMTINLATIGSFSIRANTCNGQNVGSVKFVVNGATVKIESAAPYAIAGDNNGIYTAWPATTGVKTLIGTPYSQGGGGGSAGISETVSFTVINQSSGTPDCNGVPGGTAFIDDCGVCSGGNTGHVADSDKDACGVCFGDGSTCSGECQPLEVTTLMLVHEGTAGEIGPLTNGMTIDLSTIGNFSIRADVCSSTAVKSVKFILNGTVYKTESIPPYAIEGDVPTGSFKKWSPAPGNYTLTVTPYSSPGGNGAAGISLARNFTVISGSAKKEMDDILNPENEFFSLYPNPNNGMFTIEFEMPERGNVNIRVYNQLGQTVYSEVEYYSESFKKQITTNQPSGIYLIQLTTGNRSFSKRVIIRN